MFHPSHTTPLPQGRDLAQSQKKGGAVSAPLTPPSRAAVSPSPSRPRPCTRGCCHRRLALALAASAAAAPSLFNYPGPDWAQQTAGLPSAKRRHRPALSGSALCGAPGGVPSALRSATAGLPLSSRCAAAAGLPLLALVAGRTTILPPSHRPRLI